MTSFPTPSRDRTGLLVLLAAVAVALVSARPYAGAWNDGSRLATVEALVDHHTLAIDRSVFVAVPPENGPYHSDDPAVTALLQRGTQDKLLIEGHFYSDKSPVPALLLALAYQVLQWLTGLTARHDPAAFCYLMTAASSGLAYVVAVVSVYRVGEPLRLPRGLQLALTVSFALSTVALVYVRHVNNHIVLLGVSAALMLQLAHLAEDSGRGAVSWRRLAAAGALAGLGYAIDLGAGPVLLACALALVAWRGGMRAGGVALLAALPWLVLHHAVNYAVGGTFRPANANPEYFAWDGCPFNAQNMTGAWNHNGAGGFVVYALALLFGKHGFIGHNLPLFLALAAMVAVLRRRGRELPEVLFAGFCCGGVWLAYAVTSRNYSGQCCSVRWFVPLLAPAFYVLAVYLRDAPRRGADLAILSAWGGALAAVAWWHGPWIRHMIPGFWLWQGAAAVTWACYRWKTRLPQSAKHPAAVVRRDRSRAA